MIPSLRGQRANKYGAKRTLGWGGRMYDSRAERDYRTELALREAAGDVREIFEQPVVELVAGITYRPDFRFYELYSRSTHQFVETGWRKIFVDVKGVETDVFRLKAKLWRQFGPGPLRIVKRRGSRGAFVVTKEIPGGAA